MRLRRVIAGMIWWFFPVAMLSAVVIFTHDAVGFVSSTLARTIAIGVGAVLCLVILATIGTVVMVARVLVRPPQGGVEVTRDQHPAMWATVDELAQLAETAPPDRIVLDGGVNMGANEYNGIRTLVIGLPLFASLPLDGMRSAIAHELCHLAGGDTAGPLMFRYSTLKVASSRIPRLFQLPIGMWLSMYAAVCGPIFQKRELRADRLALQAGGLRSSVEMLRLFGLTEVAFNVLGAGYVPMFEQVGKRASVLEGVAELITHNRTDFDKTVEKAIRDEVASSFETHPPIRERITALEAMARAGISGPDRDDLDEPAYALFTDGAEWLKSIEEQLYIWHWPLGDWDEVMTVGMTRQLELEAERSSAKACAIGFGDGSLDNLLTLLSNPAPAGSPAAAAAIINAPLLLALIAAGHATLQPSWTHPLYAVNSKGEHIVVWEWLTEMAESRDEQGARSLLAGLGVTVS